MFLDHVARLSGAEICLSRLIAAADGIESTVILAEEGPLESLFAQAGARVEVMPMVERTRGLTRAQLRGRRARLGAVVDVATYADRLRRRLGELRPHVVHTNTLKSGVYGTLAARLAGIPSVWYLQDNLSVDSLPRQLVPTMRLLVSSMPNVLIAPSRATLRTAGTRRRPGLRREVIPLPVPRPEHAVELADEVRAMGMVGRLTPWKGQHVFLEAFARAFPGPSVRARLIGTAMFGEDDYELELRDQAQRLGIADRVDFLGFVHDVPAELARLDVLVHCSVLPDPFANALLEGMAAGVPVIGADAGGPGEYVDEGVDGLKHEPGNVAELAAALTRLASDGELRAQLAAGGREKARQFTADAVAHRMLDMYQEVARTAGRTR